MYQDRALVPIDVGPQVPLDLVALPVRTVCGADLAKQYVVQVRPRWTEPTNLFSVVAPWAV